MNIAIHTSHSRNNGKHLASEAHNPFQNTLRPVCKLESIMADFPQFSNPFFKVLVLKGRLGTGLKLQSIFRLSNDFFIS